MEDYSILNILLYIIINYSGYSIIVIFKLLLITDFTLKYHITQLFLSNICLLLIIKIHSTNDFIINEKSQKSETIPNLSSSEKPIGENDPIVQFNSLQNIGCDICKIDKLPLRAHHCEFCNKCVRCYDHHCWALAGCIGENNRLLFLLFLILQNCSIDCGLIAIIVLINQKKSEDFKYFLTFYFSIICCFSIIFKFVLVYHSYLFFTNQTNYELFNEDKCPYLIIYSFKKNKYLQQKGNGLGNEKRYRPFDLGFKKNFMLFFQKLFKRDRKGIVWEDIFYENLKKTSIEKSCC